MMMSWSAPLANQHETLRRGRLQLAVGGVVQGNYITRKGGYVQ